jgi:choline dehydrogenase-like flavoprotein
MQHYSNDEPVDALVIGTGAGGAPLMARLAGAGLSVVALEAVSSGIQRAISPRMRKSRTNCSGSMNASAPAVIRSTSATITPGIGVGGSTLHYTAYTPRAQPDDFRLRTEFGVGRDWPFSYEQLEPYYDELEDFLGVSGPSPYPWGPPRQTRYPFSPLPLNGPAQLMERACSKLGIRTSPAPNAALSAPYYQPGFGWRPACTNRGFCQAGCSTGAKASMDVTFIPLAIGKGAELPTESFATEFETDAMGKISAVVYQRNGVTERQRCRNLFLCAGAVETPRLLLLNGLANSSGQVGRNFMAHTGVQLWGPV